MIQRILMVLAATLIVACSSPVLNVTEGTGSPRAFTGTTYYVAPTGSDTTGTGAFGAPWKTLGYAASHVPAGAGNGISLAAGTYNEPSMINLPVGVGIEGAGAASTVVKYTGGQDGTLIQLLSSTHMNGNQQLSGFAVDGNNKLAGKGIRVVGRDNVVLHDLVFTNSKYDAIQVIAQEANGKPAFTLSGVQIFNSTFTNNSYDFVDWSTGVIAISGLTGAQIHHNTINETGGYGIKFDNQYGDFYGIKIYDNNITVNPVDAAWGSDCGIELWNVYSGSEVYNNTLNTWMSLVNQVDSAGVVSVLVHDNRIVSALTNNPKEAIEAALSDGRFYNNYVEQARWGIAMWQETSRNNWVYNNVFYNPTAMTQDLVAGVYLFPQAGNMSGHKFYNNLFEGFQHGMWLKGFTTATLTNIEIKNNIFQNLRVDPTYGASSMVAFWITNGGGTSAVSNFTVQNNLSFNAGTTPWSGQPTNLTQSGNLWSTNPQLTNSGIRPNPYYVPASGSIVIDAGVNVGLPYSGNAPDIGAFEAASGGTSTVATPTFSPAGGTYTSAQSVTISTSTSGASIRYTTDGSTPSSTLGTLYSGPVTVSTSQTLKALAYKSGSNDSSVATALFTISTSAYVNTGGTSAASGTSAAAETSVAAFDQNNATKWCITSSKIGWIKWDWTGSTTKTVTSYTITSAADNASRDPKSWQFQGSNDGTSWIALDTQSNQTFAARGQTNTYTVANTAAYQQYRLNVTANNGASKILQLAELAMFGY